MSPLHRLVSRVTLAGRRWRRVAALGLTAISVVTGCDARENGPAGVDGSSAVRLAVATNIVAAPGAVVEAIVRYTPPGGTAVVVGRDSIDIDTGGADAALALTADVSDCVAAAGSNPCQLSLQVRLTRNGALLDESTSTLSVTAGQVDVVVTTIELFEVTSVVITPTALTGLEPGDSVQLSAVGRDRNGGTVAARTVAWSVVGSAVTVSTTGMVRAVSQGSATVRASIGGRFLDLPVTVGAPTVAFLTITPTDAAVFVGGTVPFVVVARSSTGAVLTGRTITFSSSQAAVAPINSAGLATGVAPGTVTITASNNQGRNGALVTTSTTLRVDPLAIAVTPNALSFETEVGQPLPPAQAVNVTNATGGNIGTLSLVTPLPAELTASLNSSTAPATLTIRPSVPLAPGSNITRTVTVRTTNVNVAPVSVTVTIVGRTPSVFYGRFAGLVVNATNSQPIATATVIVRNQANAIVSQVATNAAGQWLSDSLPSGTYSIEITHPSFLGVTFQAQTLAGAFPIPTTSAPTAALVPIGSNPGNIFGDVRDATNDAPLLGATVELRAGANNTTGTPIAVTTTDATGFYAFSAQPAGTYTVRATRAGYSAGSVFVPVTGGSALAPVVFLSPTGVNVAWRFVLSWGASPSDLDAHLTGPIAESAQRFHVYFGDRGSFTASPFALLDVDVLDGFGPETITMSQQTGGVYRYFVDNFSEEISLRSSTARVDVYQGSTLVRQFFPPQQDGYIWTVFELDGTTLTGIGTIGTTPPLPAAMSAGPRRKIDSAAEEWYQLGPHTWRKPSGTRSGKR